MTARPSWLPDRVRIVEVGPRDGLQNEAAAVSTEAKVAFIRALAGAGLGDIEATSFVHPAAVPQLADAADVWAALPGDGGARFSALVPNERGLDRALECGVRRIAVFTAASDAFTERNIRMTVAESLDVFRAVVARARAAGATARGYLSTAFVCPYAGEVPTSRVVDVAGALIDMGCDEVAISDTLGAAAPPDIERVVGAVSDVVPVERLALHLHDTYGTALANVCAGLRLGITIFDGAAGGLGGCPYAQGASGNVATEDLVYLLDRMGVATGVDLVRLVAAAQQVAGAVGRAPSSRNAVRLGWT